MKTVYVKFKTVYGKEMIYPHGDNARLFAALIGKLTFSRQDLDLISNLGFRIVNVIPNDDGINETILESQLAEA